MVRKFLVNDEAKFKSLNLHMLEVHAGVEERIRD